MQPHRELEPPQYAAKGNLLLAALPAADYERLSPAMNLVALRMGEVLKEPGSQLLHFYFPVSGVVALLNTLQHRGADEIAVIGNDGCVGTSILLSESASSTRVVVQIAGYAYQVKPEVILA
jgi:signal-transduction protein with cAMP-binding, CBS, and nucleotidyltransferase domain